VFIDPLDESAVPKGYVPAGVKSKGNNENMPAVLAITYVLKYACLSAARRLGNRVSVQSTPDPHGCVPERNKNEQHSLLVHMPPEHE
jgi:hypothetical protein